MRYRLLYKRFAETAQKFLLVEDVIEADTFEIRDGCLVFVRHRDEQHAMPTPPIPVSFMALPPTMWIHIEPETSQPLVESGN